MQKITRLNRHLTMVLKESWRKWMLPISYWVPSIRKEVEMNTCPGWVLVVGQVRIFMALAPWFIIFFINQDFAWASVGWFALAFALMMLPLCRTIYCAVGLNKLGFFSSEVLIWAAIIYAIAQLIGGIAVAKRYGLDNNEEWYCDYYVFDTLIFFFLAVMYSLIPVMLLLTLLVTLPLCLSLPIEFCHRLYRPDFYFIERLRWIKSKRDRYNMLIDRTLNL